MPKEPVPPAPDAEDRLVTAVIRRSLIQGICGVAVVAGLSVSSAMDHPVELMMVGQQTDRVESTSSHPPVTPRPIDDLLDVGVSRHEMLTRHPLDLPANPTVP